MEPKKPTGPKDQILFDDYARGLMVAWVYADHVKEFPIILEKEGSEEQL